MKGSWQRRWEDIEPHIALPIPKFQGQPHGGQGKQLIHDPSQQHKMDILQTWLEIMSALPG